MDAPVAGQGAAPSPDRPYPPAAQAWTACAILTLGCVLAFMDRGILSLFIQPIQRDLLLSDTQISLLIGFAFAVFNALFGLPIARLVDSGNRKVIAAIGVIVWSTANGLCGVAVNFWQMFGARIGVGAGEAAVTPAAVSLLADYFPPHRRGTALGVVYSGMFLGAGGVLLLGGLIWRAIGDRLITVPLLGPLHSWQVILIGFAGLGLIVGPLTLLIREPVRRDGDLKAAGAVTVSEVGRFYRDNARTMFGHNIGFCLHNFALHAGSAWLPVILMRTQGWPLPKAGLVYGLMMIVLAPMGSILAGTLADRVVGRGRSDGRLIVAMAGAGVSAIASLAIGLFHDPVIVIPALMAFSFFAAFTTPLAPGALQDIMPNAMRGQATAIYVFWTNVVSGGTAVTLVALLTDYVFRDPLRTNLSFAIVSAAGSICAVLILAGTRANFRRLAAALARAHQARVDDAATLAVEIATA
ncbi:MFS transporter [Sphingomonas oligophenolica]|uniref:MFS transporter n=1 Tax=Sphingomonas oligophenolica TaxID=301154 RepID=A0ABU9Y9H9_9SPHN